MSDLLEMARNLRPHIEQAAQSLPDADGLKAKAMYPRWEVLVKKGSVEAEAGYRFTYNGDLYKCTDKNPQIPIGLDSRQRHGGPVRPH